ncbi:hypothetical protein E4T50_01062, partial [Aureobasidium sp. EXF-12298]
LLTQHSPLKQHTPVHRELFTRHPNQHTFLLQPFPGKENSNCVLCPPRSKTSSPSSLTRVPPTDPFAEADEDTGEIKQSNQSSYIHIRIQQRNGRKTLTTVQGLPKKFDQKKILKVIKKAFACNGTIVSDTEMGEVIQLQGDQRKDVQEFLCDKKEGLGLDAKTIKVCPRFLNVQQPRHAPSSGTRDQPVDHHDICSSFRIVNKAPIATILTAVLHLSTTLTNFLDMIDIISK